MFTRRKRKKTASFLAGKKSVLKPGRKCKKEFYASVLLLHLCLARDKVRNNPPTFANIMLLCVIAHTNFFSMFMLVCATAQTGFFFCCNVRYLLPGIVFIVKCRNTHEAGCFLPRSYRARFCIRPYAE